MSIDRNILGIFSHVGVSARLVVLVMLFFVESSLFSVSSHGNRGSADWCWMGELASFVYYVLARAQQNPPIRRSSAPWRRAPQEVGALERVWPCVDDMLVSFALCRVLRCSS